MCVKSLQSCLTLCDTLNCSPPGSPVHGILQARMLEWVAMPSSRGSSQSRDPNYVSYDCLLHWHTVSLPLTPALGSLYGCMHVYIQYIYVFCAVLSHSDLTQGLNSGLPHCRQILYRLSTREAQEYWSGQSISSPGSLPDSGIKLGFPALLADSLPAELPGNPAIMLLDIYPDRLKTYIHLKTYTQMFTVALFIIDKILNR